jgi:cbb3-type cytochrome oxidase subunit 3
MDRVFEFILQYGLFLGIPLAFIAIVVWVYRPGAKKRYQADGNIPFDGDKKGKSGKP